MRYRGKNGLWGNVFQFTITITNPTRFYYVKDHLGSVRLTLDEDGEIVSWDDYDPWGLTLAGRSGILGSTATQYNPDSYREA